MNPSQHTPGPWTVDAATFPREPSDRFGIYSVATGALLASCNLGEHDSGEIVSPYEEAANARLIAAAPELLAALEAILAESDHDGYGARTDAQIPRLRAALGTARTAIAKAKGGAS